MSTASEQISQADIARAMDPALHGQGAQIMPTLAEKWLEQGREEGLTKSILRVLTRRFGLLPVETVSQVEDLSIDLLEEALDIALDAHTLSDFTQQLGDL